MDLLTTKNNVQQYGFQRQKGKKSHVMKISDG